jgi:hypothetical protein
MTPMLLRSLGLAILLPGGLFADVVVLKDGTKVSGKVVDKAQHYEVTTEAGLRTFLKEEVDHLITNPKELLGETDRLFEEAKEEYTQALSLPADQDRNEKLRDALGKVKTVREALAQARELFPDEKFAELDAKLLQVMQLTRLLRERVTHDSLAREPERPSVGASTRPVSKEELIDGFKVLLTPSLRADAGKRAVARENLRHQRFGFPEIYDVATAAMLFLSRTDADWKLQGPLAKAFEGYLEKGWLKEPLKLTPITHLEAAAWLADQAVLLRKADTSAALEPLALFGMGHLAHAPAGPEAEKTAKTFGFTVQNGIIGTAEGHVVRDLNGWIAAGEYDLAVLAFVKEYRAIDTPIVRFVWSYALLRLAQAKKKGFDRPVSALQAINVSEAPARDEIGALAKSIKAVASCSYCLGEGRYRCTNCHGKKEIRVDCAQCKGTGKQTLAGRGLRSYQINCTHCHGRGYELLIKCEKCKDGVMTCSQCGGKTHKPPELDEICTVTPCPDCEGRGWSFRRALWACRTCMGVGQLVTPKAEPPKLPR